ncbi:ribose-phosphate pyrophosphokinase [Patescibacteria group bacterium]|nr:ribose-phosphate pyrophosphokinase [Patescibacteria group bacterium]
MQQGKIQLIAGRSHPALAKKISKVLKISLTPVTINNFANGEIYFRVEDKVRNNDVFFIQTFCPPVNENLMEMLIGLDALRRASAGQINIICPHFGYARQDRKVVSREPITAKLVANLITKAGADRLVTVDLHAAQIQGFFDIPVDHFVGYPQFAQYLRKQKLKDPVVVSPDVGGVRRGRQMACLLGCPLVIVDKRRVRHNCAEMLSVIGEVKGKTAILIDDIIDTAGTISAAADGLKERGAKKVIICVTHGVFSGSAHERLNKCGASQILALDTVPIETKKLPKLKLISLAPLLAKIITRIHEGQSLGELFDWEKKVGAAV